MTRDSEFRSPRWAIIGASRIAARRMIPAIRRVANGQPLAVHSHNETRARAFAEAQQIPHPFTDLDEMLTRFDFGHVYVGNHPRHHAEAVGAALRAGKHVLCEAPLALTRDEAVALTRMAVNRGLTLALNQTARATPQLRAMQRLLAAERVGTVIAVRVSNARALPAAHQGWRLAAPGGGVLWDRTLHDIDTVRWLLNDEPLVVAGAAGQAFLADRPGGRAGDLPVEEELFVQLRMARSGAHVHLHDSFLLPHVEDALEVHGTQGSLIAQRWTEPHVGGGLRFMRGGQSEDATQWLTDNDASGDTDPDRAVVAAFLAVSRGEDGAPPITLATGEDGVKNVAIALKLADVLRRARYVSLAGPEEL